jgi:hypothetical protein
MNEIIAIFPEARFVNLIRDGVDVVSSMLNARLAKSLSSAAARWKNSILHARRFAQKHPGACIDIRYEDLAREPYKTTDAVCRFLSISYSPEMVESLEHSASMRDIQLFDHLRNAGRRVNDDSIGQGLKTLSGEQKQRLLDLIGPQLKELGYLASRQ